MSRKSRKRLTARQRQELNARFIAWLVILGIGFWFLVYLVQNYGVFIGIIVAVTLALVMFWQIRKFLRRRRMTSELGSILKKALKAMDDTARTYTNEEEANKELVGILKSQGYDATYQFRLGDDRTADAKVENVLVEGKLAPHTAEVDRLIGQIGAYSRYSYRVNVVIYGYLSKTARERIENEIDERYRNKVFLTYLENPRRRRA